MRNPTRMRPRSFASQANQISVLEQRRSRPILESLEDRTVPAGFIAPTIYQNPFMAANNFSEIHLNAFQTDTFTTPGPAATPAQSIQQSNLGGPSVAIAGTTAFTSKGLLVTIRVGLQQVGDQFQSQAQTLQLIDPITLQVIASTSLPPRPSSSGTVSFAGGGYFYLDNLDRVVCVTANQQIRIYSTFNNQFNLISTFDVSSAINNQSDILNSVLPDSSGNLWFITDQGVVGYVRPTDGAIFVTNVRDVPGANPAETDTKSFCTDAQGGVYVVSDYALYRFQVGAEGAPVDIWRAVYDRGVRVKPGQNQQGSGTTPTAFDDFQGNQFITIADNADPFMHIDVFNRQTGALVAAQAVFTALPFVNSCENSLIAVNHSVMIENNYGNVGISSTLGSNTTMPGVARMDFNPANGTAQVVWTNYAVAVPSVVSQLSTGDGNIYTYAKDATGWYWGSIDFATGGLTAATRVPLSNVAGGLFANNFYSGLTIGPNGAAYVGTLGGYIVWRPLGQQNLIYVSTVYQKLLDRSPDPAGLGYFTTLLNLGVSRATVVLVIESTTEFRGIAVNNVYERYLGRPADAAGLFYGVQFLAMGGTIDQISASLIGSAEFYQRSGGTNASFLNAMYEDILSRPIDPVAQAILSQQLALGVPRNVMAFNVGSTPEANANLVSQLYLQLLGRAVDPLGLGFWTSQLLQGSRIENVIAGLVGSDEFFTNNL